MTAFEQRTDTHLLFLADVEVEVVRKLELRFEFLLLAPAPPRLKASVTITAGDCDTEAVVLVWPFCWSRISFSEVLWTIPCSCARILVVAPLRVVPRSGRLNPPTPLFELPLFPQRPSRRSVWSLLTPCSTPSV